MKVKTLILFPLHLGIIILEVQVMKKKHGQIERVIANVQASMAVEGLKPSAKARVIGTVFRRKDK